MTLWSNKKGFSFLLWTELDGGSPMGNTKPCIHLHPPPPTFHPPPLTFHSPPPSIHLHSPSTYLPITSTHLPVTPPTLLHNVFFLRVHLSVNLSKLTRFFIKDGFYKNRLDLHTFKVGGGGWKVSGGSWR